MPPVTRNRRGRVALAATAGDRIGATTFESLINQDKPTIPPKAKPGMRYLRVFGKKTGTSVKVPIRITRK